MKIVYIDSKDLMPLEGNQRKVIDEEEVEKLIVLIEQHGFQNSLQVFKEKTYEQKN